MTIAVPVPCLILRYAISRRSYDALSPPRPWAGARVAPLRKAHHLLNTRRLLLFLERHDLLAAVPPLLLAELKRLGLDLLDGQRFGLYVLPPEACH